MDGGNRPLSRAFPASCPPGRRKDFFQARARGVEIGTLLPPIPGFSRGFPFPLLHFSLLYTKVYSATGGQWGVRLFPKSQGQAGFFEERRALPGAFRTFCWLGTRWTRDFTHLQPDGSVAPEISLICNPMAL